MNSTIARLAFQSLVGQKRWWVLVALPLLLGTLGLTAAAFVLGRRRYDPDLGLRARRRDGRAPFALSMAVVALALTELLALTLGG